jgi:uncharacterized protein DUF4326
MIEVAHVNNYKGAGVYIGRPCGRYPEGSVLGNPYKVEKIGSREKEGSREKAIELYRIWLWDRLKERGQVYDEMKRLVNLAKQGDLILLCWCQPKSCHGQIIRQAIEKWDTVEAAIGRVTRRSVLSDDSAVEELKHDR